MSEETSLEFPCRFPIKAMTRAGEASDGSDPVDQVIQAVEQHAGPQDRDQVVVRASARGNYRAVTIVIQAQSKDQLDAIYQELTALDSVVMAL